LGSARDQETCSQKHSLAWSDGEGHSRLLQVQEQADCGERGKVSEQKLDLRFEFLLVSTCADILTRSAALCEFRGPRRIDGAYLRPVRASG